MRSIGGCRNYELHSMFVHGGWSNLLIEILAPKRTRATAMDKFDRIFQLHDILRRRRTPISARDLQLKMECSRATLHRSLTLLRDYLHAPVHFDSNAGGYRYTSSPDSPSYELPGLWFSASELQALALLQRFAKEASGGILDEQFTELARHLTELTNHKRLNLSEASSRFRFPSLVARPAGESFEVVLSATLQRRQVRLDYHARGTDQRTTRTISPQRIVYYREAWYLDLWDEGNKGLRTFSIDRISNAAILSKPATPIADDRLDSHFASFGMFGGLPDKKAVLVFSAEKARWVADEIWHPNKTARFLEDGRYELTVLYRDSRELVMEILRHGAHVKVISTDSLREEVAENLAGALKQYQP